VFCVFHSLARVVECHTKLAQVDHLGLYVRTFFCLLKNKARSVFASPSLTSGPKNHRNKKWACHFNTGFTGFVRSKESENQLNHFSHICRHSCTNPCTKHAATCFVTSREPARRDGRR